jgi:hypothetical protein
VQTIKTSTDLICLQRASAGHHMLLLPDMGSKVVIFINVCCYNRSHDNAVNGGPLCTWVTQRITGFIAAI